MTPARALDAAAAGAAVLTVNKRLARTLAAAYNARQIARGLEAWETPDVLPWGSWLERVWRQSPDAASTVLLAAVQERYIWERTIAESPDAGRLLDLPDAARAAMQAWGLAMDWQLPLSGEDWERSEDTRAFLGWTRAFRAACEREHWLDRARLAGSVAASLRAGCLRPPACVLLEGFDELTPGERDILDALRTAGCKVEIADTGGGQREAALLPLADADDEVEQAARWARSLLEQGANGPIGIVVPDLEARRKKVERVFATVLHPGRPDVLPRAFNVSAAPPLMEQPAVKTAFLALGLGLGRLTPAAAGSLLRSPFLPGAETELAARAHIDVELRGTGEADITFDALFNRTHRCPQLERSLGTWRGVWRNLSREQTPARWSLSFARLLDALGWPGGRTRNSAEYQAVEAWRRLLSGFASLDGYAAAMSYGEALSRLARLAGETAFQPEADAAEPVQILGVLEASGQRFDHLWIMGLHDEAWPAAAKPNPFLPLSLQREHGVPHATPSRELAFARLVTERLLASAPRVIVSYPRREGDRDLRPSPLVADLARADVAIPQFSTLLDRTFCAGGSEAKEEQFAPLPDGVREIRGGTKIFKLQAACPFWAFGEFRLGARALESAEFGLRALDRGTLVHRALELVWKELRTHANLCGMFPEMLDALVDECVSEAIEDRRAVRPQAFTPRFTALERARVVRLVREWLDQEKQRAAFEVVRQEHKRTTVIGGLKFTARTDRVDRLAGGAEVIIDYKTGEVDLKKWDGPRPDEPQLPIYCTPESERLAGVLFGQLKTGKVRFLGIARDGNVAPGAKPLAEQQWQAKLEDWRQTLEGLAADFRAGRAEPDPKKPGETCTRCGLTALCRARELGQYCVEAEDNGD